MFVSGEVEKGELISLGGGFLIAKFESELLVELDRSCRIGDTDTGVEKFNHSGGYSRDTANSIGILALLTLRGDWVCHFTQAGESSGVEIFQLDPRSAVS